MSEYNLKIKRWDRDGDVRYYLDGHFVEFRSEQSGAECVFLYRKDDGSVGWRHGFVCGPHTVARAERNAFAAMSAIKGLWLDRITFDEFERRYTQSLTKSGNFSVRQYEKQFQLPELAA